METEIDEHYKETALRTSRTTNRTKRCAPNVLISGRVLRLTIFDAFPISGPLTLPLSFVPLALSRCHGNRTVQTLRTLSLSRCPALSSLSFPLSLSTVLPISCSTALMVYRYPPVSALPICPHRRSRDLLVASSFFQYLGLVLCLSLSLCIPLSDHRISRFPAGVLRLNISTAFRIIGTRSLLASHSHTLRRALSWLRALSLS